MTINSLFVQEEARAHNVFEDSIIYQYITRKTKAAERDSKSRRSLGNLYALYALCLDYLNDNEEGSTFTILMGKIKTMPFGAKLQNHALDNRLNDEVKRQYSASDDMLPVQYANLRNGGAGRKISVMLLAEKGMNPKETAAFVVASIEKYIQIIDDNQTAYLNEIELAETDSDVIRLIQEAFEYNSDARLFEIISFSLLHMHFRQYSVSIELADIEYINPVRKLQELTLYRTGRTNANDGGIDFVLQPLGKFFQVTESLDFKKYFLDFDKINKFKLSFVIKTELSASEVIEKIRRDANSVLDPQKVDSYISLFDEIFTLHELREILRYISSSHLRIAQLKEIVINCFKLEYGLLD